MPRLLIVHHTSSPPLQDLLEAAKAGASRPELGAIDVVVRPALGATVTDVLEADGYLLGTPANFGYMSGALKHFFDTTYYPCLDATVGRPYGLWVHGNNDVDGAVTSVERIVAGLKWMAVGKPVTSIGPTTAQVRDACSELAATLAATLLTD
jgi:multimeric flavodoxin WrbA